MSLRPALLIVFVLSLASLGCGSQESPVAGGETFLGEPLPGGRAALFAPGAISTATHDVSLTFDPRAPQVLVGRTDIAFLPVLFAHRFEGGAWQEPTLPPFASRHGNSYPMFAPDGERVFFNSSRPIEPGGENTPGRHLWVIDRQGEGWGTPQYLGAAVNAHRAQVCPTVDDEGTLYFHAWFETPDGGRDADIFFSKPVDGVYGPPTRLGPAINSSALEFHPWISPDGNLLLFDAAGREDAAGSNDLYAARRLPDGTWTPAESLGDLVNTEAADLRPRLTPDGRFLFFASNRHRSDEPLAETFSVEEALGLMGGPLNGSQDIYWIDAAAVGLAPAGPD